MSVWDISMIILAAFLVNSAFYFIPYLMPRIDSLELLIYQSFVNGIVLLLIILPKQMWSPS